VAQLVGNLDVLDDHGRVVAALQHHAGERPVIVPQRLNELSPNNVIGLGQLKDSRSYVWLHRPLVLEWGDRLKGECVKITMSQAAHAAFWIETRKKELAAHWCYVYMFIHT
jgi:hypothetical protein